VPAGRGAILLADKEGINLIPCSRACAGGADAAGEVSRTVARQVLEQGLRILGTDVPGSGDLGQVESLAAFSGAFLVMCAADCVSAVIGCIYVDSN